MRHWAWSWTLGFALNATPSPALDIMCKSLAPSPTEITFGHNVFNTSLKKRLFKKQNGFKLGIPDLEGGNGTESAFPKSRLFFVHPQSVQEFSYNIFSVQLHELKI